MSAFNHMIQQTGLDSLLLADSASSVIHASWMENLVIGLLFILGSALVLQGAWNGLLAEFPRIGRMSYFHAVHVIAVFGVFLSIIWYMFF